MSWVVVVPVKGTPGAKSRLGAVPKREVLAEAFALDTVTALVAASAVQRVFVVTGNSHLGELLATLGAVIVPEAAFKPGGVTGHARLNAAIEQGVAAARRACFDSNLAVMTGDLPALRPVDVEAAFALAAEHPRSMVPDTEGGGTTALFAHAGVRLTPRFGRGSRAAHEADGHVPLNVSLTSTMRRDVDTAADLDAARVLGLGPHTIGLAALSKR
ncbi:2-phospho-L-lactate guanylyltransferase [Cryobacterium sp. Hz9]|uniref:2-phospho-L-lactate guanylyltransferase n=1 Tax=Cryobacterium sp. Hz9 TaxID=1259167 RepID=UPI00106D33C6|nr:2-phospho-L-lactate guanylyltransferase [Cryobacterium sp. Hz9]TFB70904.1 2-phospho-L-lactate guanylyltransferase [Cryobacterium sp. Hz9]